MATRLRFDIGGFVALGLERYVPRTHKADALIALCLSPTLVHHVPRLTVLRDDVNLASTTLRFTAYGDRLIFDAQELNLTVNARPAGLAGVTVPMVNLLDPIADDGVVFKLQPITAIPWMATLAGHGALRADCVWPVTATEVTTALRLTSGVLYGRQLESKTGADAMWRFWDEGRDYASASWQHRLEVADRLICEEWIDGSITIDATSRTGAPVGRISFLEGRSPIIVKFRHDCRGLGTGACKGTEGAQFDPFYDLLDRPARRPRGLPEKLSDSGYCPPALFWD